jgi:hypothetical protein
MRTLLLTIFISISALLKSQAYVPFPTDSVKWTDGGGSYSSCRPNTPSPCCIEREIVIEKDTLISGVVYHKLLGYPIGYPGCGNPFYSLITYPVFVAGYFRNDSANKKVYYKEDPNSNEVLLYDFDLVLNQRYPDTYLMDSLNNLANLPYRYREYYVFKISTGSYFGSNRNVYHLAENYPYRDTIELVEGIGASSGFLNTLLFTELSYFQYSSGQCWRGLDKNLQPCALTVGEVELINNEIEPWAYYYNSSSQSIEFTAVQPITQLFIYNLSGQKVGEYRPQADQVSVNLKKGIYLLQAIDQDGSLHSGKLAVN